MSREPTASPPARQGGESGVMVDALVGLRIATAGRTANEGSGVGAKVG